MDNVSPFLVAGEKSNKNKSHSFWNRCPTFFPQQAYLNIFVKLEQVWKFNLSIRYLGHLPITKVYKISNKNILNPYQIRLEMVGCNWFRTALVFSYNRCKVNFLTSKTFSLLRCSQHHFSLYDFNSQWNHVFLHCQKESVRTLY